MDELEQGEQVRAWLRQNGSTILIGLVLGVLAIFAVNWWQTQQTQRAFAAGAEFHRMDTALEAGDHEQARAHAEVLRNDFHRSPYAVLAALRIASLEVDEGHPEAALATISSALEAGRAGALEDLLHVRAARIEIAIGQPQSALDRLTRIGPEYEALAADLRGDALLALDRRDEARDAYQAALAALDAAAPVRRLVELKLLDLGGTVTPEA